MGEIARRANCFALSFYQSLLLGAFAFLFTGSAFSKKLDLSIQNELIVKLTSVIDEANDSTQMIQQKNMILRLADLHSERARALALSQDAEGDRVSQSQIDADRRRALFLYKKNLENLDPEEEGRVRLQMSHLHLLLGERSKALVHLEKLASDKRRAVRAYRAQALVQLGDFSFEKNQFAEAMKLFEQALDLPENPRKAYAESRVSWCLLNLGKIQAAESRMVRLLSKQSLFANSEGDRDEAFLAEASRDLATFMAQNDVSRSKVEQLIQLSPASAKQSNLIHLATELDRTSKKKSALLVWSFVDQKAITIQERVQRQIHLARIQYDMGDRSALLREIKESLSLLMSADCVKVEDCRTQVQDLRRIVTDWGKAEERKPSPELIRSYVEFLKFNDDFEMAYWAAQAASQRNEHLNAYKLYHYVSRSDSLRELLKEKNDSRLERIFEGSLLAAVESAERVGDKKLMKEAYFHYIKLAPEGAKTWEVRYQIARLFYEENNFTEALGRFRQIALNSEAPRILRNKSADLFFDTLAIQKDDPGIENEALVFEKNFPTDKEKFRSLWRKSLLKQSAAVLRDTQSSSSELREQLAKLGSISSQSWPPVEKKQIQKNQLLLAYRLRDLEAVERSLSLYLSNKLTPLERQEALASLAWSQEMRFDFSRALSTIEKMNLPKAKKPLQDHFFKMALLAELAGKDMVSGKYYKSALKNGLSGPRARFAAAQLIQLNRSSAARDFRAYKDLLSKDPQLFAQSALAAWEGVTPGEKKNIEKLLKGSRFSSTPEASLLRTSAALEELTLIQKTIFVSLGNSESVQQKNLGKRISSLQNLERWTQKGVSSGDLTIQFVGLAELSRGYKSLVQDVRKLPLPRGLKKEEVLNYQNQISLQLKPYVEKAATMETKAKDVFRKHLQEDFLRDLTLWSLTPQRAGSGLAKQELTRLRKTVEELGGSGDIFVKMTRSGQQLHAESKQVQELSQRDPFNINTLQRLKDSKSALQDGLWVAYLNSRISEMSLRNSLRGEAQ